MNETIKLGLILLLITSVAALVLGLTNMVTLDKINEAEAMVSEEARKEVLVADKFEIVDGHEEGNILEVYEGKKGDEVVGYAIKSFSSNAYAGNIYVITGISIDGKVSGIKVVSHQETPGLGANAENDDFRNEFKDKSTENKLEVGSDIEALTGATITSKAVTEAVNFAIELYNEQLAK